MPFEKSNSEKFYLKKVTLKSSKTEISFSPPSSSRASPRLLFCRFTHPALPVFSPFSRLFQTPSYHKVFFTGILFRAWYKVMMSRVPPFWARSFFLQRPLPGLPISWNHYQPVRPAGESPGEPWTSWGTGWNSGKLLGTTKNTRFRIFKDFLHLSFTRNKIRHARKKAFILLKNWITASFWTPTPYPQGFEVRSGKVRSSTNWLALTK